MLSDAQIVGRHRDTVGSGSVTQGVYGERGNLELVACDARDGLWVFWFNSDPLGTPPSGGVEPGRWSDGLAFAAGSRYIRADILQSTLGPDHLEVLALDDAGVLQSWYWSPGPGFQRREGSVATGVGRFAAEHRDGTLTVAVDGPQPATWESDAAGYPNRIWRRVAASVVRLDSPGDDDRARRALLQAGIDSAGIVAGSARCASSTRDGGTAELTWRGSDGLLRHLGVPVGAWEAHRGA